MTERNRARVDSERGDGCRVPGGDDLPLALSFLPGDSWVMKLALPNPSGPVFELTPELRAQGLRESRLSPRLRMLLPIHRTQEDLVQRMVNFLQPGTFIRAHQHPRDWATETLLVISGCLGFVTFDENGEVLTVHRLGVGEMVDIEARVWHAVLALAEDTVILEIKRGPFNEEDKVFASWSPSETSAEAPAHLSWLRGLCEGSPAPER